MFAARTVQVNAQYSQYSGTASQPDASTASTQYFVIVAPQRRSDPNARSPWRQETRYEGITPDTP
jgi:hypothetical protein